MNTHKHTPQAHTHSHKYKQSDTNIHTHKNTHTYIQISEDYNEKSQKNSQYTEENTLLKSEISNESELYQSELQGLRDQSEKFLKQNLSLLKNMATLEDTLEKGILI